MRSLATLLLSIVVAAPGFAATGFAAPAMAAPSAAARFDATRHDAAAVARVDVAAAALAAATGTHVPTETRGVLPVLTVANTRSRPDAPAPSLILGSSEDIPTDGSAAGSTSEGTALATDPSAPFFSNGFFGMNDTVNGCGAFTRPCIEPPDPWVAAGPSHIVQAVNVALRITDRVGSGATTVALSTFFAEPPGQILNADPRVLYDPVKGRWLATELSYDCTAGRLYLAVSDGADPTGAWTVWQFEFPGVVPDYPGLGMSADKVLMGVNLFPIVAGMAGGCSLGTFAGASLVVVDWTDIADGGDLSGIEFGPEPKLFAWRPASSQNPGSVAHAVVEDFLFGFADLGLATITGTVAGGDIAIGSFRNLTNEGLIGDFLQPPQPRQPAISPVWSTIANAVDHRPTDAVWRADRLWTTSTYPCQIEVVHACVRLIELNTADPAAPDPVVQDVLLGWMGFDSYLGGIGLALDGTAFAVYTRSSSVAAAGIHAVHQRPGDDDYRGWHQILPGSGTYLGERWGDYAGVATDPIVPNAVWQGHQYSDGSGGWATWVSQLSTGSVGTAGTVSRLAGSDRYATAAAISAATFPSGVPVAYLATGANYPDALAGGAAAAYSDAPLLLVTRDTIPASTAAELTRLSPGRIVVLGGSGVVSDAVAAALGGYTSGTVTRLAGADRYATAAATSAATFPVGVSAAYVAVGTNYPDALAGGPAAALEDSPLLLVTRDTIPAATAAELARLRPATIVVLGGTGVISDAVKAALGAYATTGAAGVVRYAGADRYATAAAISSAVNPSDVSTAYVAIGTNYPDALAGGAAAAYEDSPLLLVTFGSIPASTAAELARLSPGRIVVLGGTGVISNTVFNALAAYVAP
jgi:putative cell wall-binding protein